MTKRTRGLSQQFLICLHLCHRNTTHNKELQPKCIACFGGEEFGHRCKISRGPIPLKKLLIWGCVAVPLKKEAVAKGPGIPKSSKPWRTRPIVSVSVHQIKTERACRDFELRQFLPILSNELTSRHASDFLNGPRRRKRESYPTTSTRRIHHAK